jgi:hypothetical protein
MHPKTWRFGAMVGVATGIVAAAAMTFVDWRSNPSGIFFDDRGTHWPVVFETALSWFIPTALIAASIALAAHWWFSRP